MPIRPEEKHRYPANWKEISAAIRERAKNKCEMCAIENYAIGGRDVDGSFLRAQPIGWSGEAEIFPKEGIWGWCGAGRGKHLKIIRIVLTVAHMDHKPENCDPANLKALCQRCHLSYDAKHHAQGRIARRRAQRASGDLLGETAEEA